MENSFAKEYTCDLIKKDAIYYSARTRKLSYPEDGNEDCFELEDESFWFKHRNNCIIEVVKRFNPKDIFFDIGGGNGFVAKGLENNGVQTVLV
jgi:hypothetical protein